MSSDLVKRLEASLPGPVTAQQLAAVALEGTSLADDYPAAFSAELTARSNSASPRALEDWLVECAAFAGGNPPRSAEDLYLSLVLVDDQFAREFCRMKPGGQGFALRCKEFTDLLSHEQKEGWDRVAAIAPTPEDRIQLSSMATAIDRREAEFSQVAEGRCFQLKKFYDIPEHPDRAEAARRTYGRFYPHVLDAFEHKHGPIVQEYWCEVVPMGLVETKGGDRLHIDGDYPEAAESIVNRCRDIRQSAEEFLSPKEYEYIIADLYSLLTQFLSTLDRVVAKAGGTEEIDETELAHSAQRVSVLEDRVERRLARRGQRLYVVGTLIGLALLSTLLAGLTAVTSGDWQLLFEGAIFGGAGAIASVLFRMNQNTLKVDASQGPILVYMAAMVRPLTGALFGAIICAVALSGFLPIEVPTDDANRFYFLGVLAFIAGFSERWAPSLLEATASQIALEADKADEEPAGAAGSPKA